MGTPPTWLSCGVSIRIRYKGCTVLIGVTLAFLPCCCHGVYCVTQLDTALRIPVMSFRNVPLLNVVANLDVIVCETPELSKLC